MTDLSSAGKLLSRPPLRAVLVGKASLIGSRLDPGAPRGYFSPVEARHNLGIPYGNLRQAEREGLASRSLVGDVGIVMRSCLSGWLAASTGRERVRRPFLVSACVDNVSIDEAMARITGHGSEGHARIVHFVHPHALNLATGDRKLAEHLSKADLVLPDGVGLRIAARMLRAPLIHNINGTDLLPPLCERLAECGTPLVLVGAAPGVAEQAAARLSEQHPGLRIPLVHHGFLDDPLSRDLAQAVRALGRAVVLVGMGSPVQESWTWRYLADAPEATVVTVGGLFDFYSGRIPRAPRAWREAGVEWAWRLVQEPKRLARRYLVGNPVFLTRAAIQRAWGPSPSAQ